MPNTNQMSEGKHTPECDCGSKLCNGSMQLNGLRFVCESQCSLTDHSSRWPVYVAAPALLEALKEAEAALLEASKILQDRMPNASCRFKVTANKSRAAIAQAEKGAGE